MKFSILLASAALAGAVFAQADLDRPGAVPRATTSIGFLTPDELATTTRRYRDWKHSLFLRAAAPAGDGCDFAPTVTYNQVFAEYLDRLASQTIDTITGGLARMGQAFLQIGRELENAYASGRRASMYNSERRSAAVARFSDAIRGEEAVRNPQTGATAYISTGSDHCAITASGQQLYWNGDYNPNTDPNLNNVNWSVMR